MFPVEAVAPFWRDFVAEWIDFAETHQVGDKRIVQRRSQTKLIWPELSFFAEILMQQVKCDGILARLQKQQFIFQTLDGRKGGVLIGIFLMQSSVSRIGDILEWITGDCR